MVSKLQGLICSKKISKVKQDILRAFYVLDWKYSAFELSTKVLIIWSESLDLFTNPEFNTKGLIFDNNGSFALLWWNAKCKCKFANKHVQANKPR